jgi:bifunctional DNase/RNase
MENGIVELRIRGLSMEDDEPFVVLEDRVTDRRLFVPVGPFEASEIILEMEGISPPRPMTHDLLAEFFSEGGFSLDEVAFFGDPESGVRARLSYRKGLRRFAKEVRPSDALGLALRLSAPLHAKASFLDLQQRSALPWQRPKILGLQDWKLKALRA